MKKIPVVIKHSFTNETPVYLFDTIEEATSFIEKEFNKECKIQIEENGHVINEDIEVFIEGDKTYAKIITWYDECEDMTEWVIGTIIQEN